MEKLNSQGLKGSFPFLVYDEENNKIVGRILLNHKCNDEIFNEEFDIDIQLNDEQIPIRVFETSGKVMNNYEHKYIDGSLCLATNIEQILFLRDHDIIEWIDKYVISYFVSYMYFKKYNIYPFGDRSHGQFGNAEFLKEYFNVEDEIKAFEILRYIKTGKYRGHNMCPCGSNKNLRSCHGKIVIDCIKNKKLFDKIYDDIVEEIKKNESIRKTKR